MFSNPVSAFTPLPDDLAAGESLRSFLVHAVERCIEAGDLDGDATDLAHVLMALIQGLAAQEAAGWMGTSRTSIDRRWSLATRAVVAGFRRSDG
jgi:hypothetical protein